MQQVSGRVAVRSQAQAALVQANATLRGRAHRAVGRAAVKAARSAPSAAPATGCVKATADRTARKHQTAWIGKQARHDSREKCYYFYSYMRLFSVRQRLFA